MKSKTININEKDQKLKEIFSLANESANDFFDKALDKNDIEVCAQIMISIMLKCLQEINVPNELIVNQIQDFLEDRMYFYKAVERKEKLH